MSLYSFVWLWFFILLVSALVFLKNATDCALSKYEYERRFAKEKRTNALAATLMAVIVGLAAANSETFGVLSGGFTLALSVAWFLSRA